MRFPPSPPPVPTLMVSSERRELGRELLAEYKGQKFKHDDLVDVICGTGHGVPEIKSEPIKARFKGVVETVRGKEFLCRPLVESSRGPCPSYPSFHLLMSVSSASHLKGYAEGE